MVHTMLILLIQSGLDLKVMELLMIEKLYKVLLTCYLIH
nr:MAG TPA: hypothetical protein [Caudoviricetes sp.]